MSSGPRPINTQQSLRGYQLLGFAVMLALLVGIGGWGALASISSAVIAPATVAVESYTKKVQHREGGIVSEIRVREGDTVRADDVLIVLSDSETKAQLAILEGQLDEVMGRRARLEAERDGAPAPSFMPALLAHADEPEVAKILNGQRKLFESETASLKGQKDQLEQRMAQLQEEIRGLTAQLQSNEKQTQLMNEELKAFKGLVTKGLIELTRVREREGAAANLEGQRGQIIANIAQAKGKISEIRLQIIQLQDDARVKVLADLGDAETKMAELLERQEAARSKLARTTIRSPVTGYVYHMAVHTIGGVVGPGETILEIVPQFDELVLAARVRPQDIDKIQMGQVGPGALPRVQPAHDAGTQGEDHLYRRRRHPAGAARPRQRPALLRGPADHRRQGAGQAGRQGIEARHARRGVPADRVAHGLQLLPQAADRPVRPHLQGRVSRPLRAGPSVACVPRRPGLSRAAPDALSRHGGGSWPRRHGRPSRRWPARRRGGR